MKFADNRLILACAVTYTSGTAPLLARDTDYYAHVLASRDSQRPLNETTGLVAADLVQSQRPLNETTGLVAADLVQFALL